VKLAFITTSLDPGGAETALAAVALGQHDAGARVSVIALRGAGRLVSRLQSGGVSVEVLGATGVGAVALSLPSVLRSLRAFDPDIVQGWMYHGNLLATVATPVCGGRLYWGIRQSLGALDRERPATNRLIRLGARLSRRPSSIVYNSERARADHEALGYARGSGRVIANGFDTTALKPDETTRLQARQRLGVAERDVLIGHLARYHPIKDHATFIASVARVGAVGRRIHVVMAGRGVDDSNPELREAIERCGLRDTISLLGEVPDVSELLPALDVLCLSSRSEAFPNVLGEAMSCGTPCVTTDVGDAARIIGATGRVVPAGDPARLADALRSLAVMRQDERARLSAAARDRIIEHYSLDSMVEQYRRTYEAPGPRH
jgi:glycosyltransferase involved in cell wall biosynthesis